MTSADSWYQLFLTVLRASYEGTATFGDRVYTFEPRLLEAYDILRKRDPPQDEFDEFLAALDARFFDVAKSELYRKGKGWIDRATQSEHARVSELEDENRYLIPRYSKDRTVGIDTSSVGEQVRAVGIFVIPDASAGEKYLGKHLKLPKTKNHPEWKWSKLNDAYKRMVMDKFGRCLAVCSEAALVIETDALTRAKGHSKTRMENLVEGCFSGYEKTEGQRRRELRKAFFSLVNGTQVHCDPDFHPMSSEEVVRILVRQLAKDDSFFNAFTPVNVPLKSHESHTIQITDILLGAFKDLRRNDRSVGPFSRLHFDKRKIRRFGSVAKVSYFLGRRVGDQVQPTVT
jgi:hypothetical protein